MQSVHGKRALYRVQAADADPVSGDLFLFVFIFDLQPFSFVDGPENVVAYGVHIGSGIFLLILYYYRLALFMSGVNKKQDLNIDFAKSRLYNLKF